MSIMPSFAAQALSAYRHVDAGNSASVSSPANGDFGSLLSESLGSALATGKSAESQAMSAIGGSGDLSSVITAVSRAELALQTTVAVRDRVLQAYQDIIKLPI